MIGIYAHHVGSGHIRRARAIQRHFREESAVLSSAPGADIELPLDVSDDVSPIGETAGDTLHWAPVNMPGLTERMAIIADFIRDKRPRVFYVDVSVEVAVFVRLMGVPVVTFAMPGARWDAPHQLGYAQASRILAAWPESAPVPEHLRAHQDKLIPVGGISLLAPGEEVPRTDEVVILKGAGGDALASLPGATVLGGDTRVDDPGPYLRRAGLVISAAGQNSVADLAFTGTPAVVIPQERPFDEQRATAQLLDELQLAVVREQMPTWEELKELRFEATRRARGWHLWAVQGSAERAARVIEEVGR